ncbi:uncharacterized protein LOC114311925 [Camellia sinensis]|uniref:uncharacterized protein LOC114311925 n=1 Tax=Camellia sinensis TaxID=4442 RepID=UPI0010366123|nr:uncharacterized protein LOC114311925 [Camellia sinensis]
MRTSFPFLTFSIFFFFTFVLHFQAHAVPSGPLIKHLSSLLKWTRSSSKIPQSGKSKIIIYDFYYVYTQIYALVLCVFVFNPDGNVLQFENGYLVETVVKGNELGVVNGYLFAIESVNSNIVRITLPLSQCKLVLPLFSLAICAN